MLKPFFFKERKYLFFSLWRNKTCLFFFCFFFSSSLSVNKNCRWKMHVLYFYASNIGTCCTKLSACKNDVTYPTGPPASTRRSISRPLNMTYTPLFLSPSIWVSVVVTRKKRACRERERKKKWEWKESLHRVTFPKMIQGNIRWIH